MNEGQVVPVAITDEIKTSFLNYAMSVIVDRALPDVRDGLKPVQRRILYAMQQEGLFSNRKHSKSAGVVGEVIKKYHPHGDVAIYDAMVRMAQGWNLRYPLVDGQGNFGCFTGDTTIKLLDGTKRSFAELAKLPPDEIFYVYSVDTEGNIVVGEGRYARATRKNAELIELTFDDGSKVRCTPDHKFMLRDGSYKEAQHLTIDDSLMAGYFDTAPVNPRTKDYLRVLQPCTGEYEFVHHLADAYNERRYGSVSRRPFVRHHKNFNRFDNRPSNIERLGWLEHMHLHAEQVAALWQDESFRQAQREGVVRYYAENPEVLEARRERMVAQNRSEAFKQENGKRVSQSLKQYHAENPEAVKRHGEYMRQLWQDPDYRAKMSRALKGIEKRPLTLEQKRQVASIIGEKSRRMWQDPVLREKITEHIITALSSPELRAELSENAKRLWRDPEYRAKFSPDHHRRMAQKLWADPATRERHREKILSQWQDPAFRAAHAEGRKREYSARLARNPKVMAELTAKAKEALRCKWQDDSYPQKVMRSKIAGYVSRLIAEHGRENVTPELYEKNRPANWVPKGQKALAYFRNFDELLDVAAVHNHRVVHIRWLDKRQDVYDITVDEHHNFMLANGCVVHNSIDGDPAAAYRYTEARMTPVAETMLADIDKETIDYKPNFDETTEEPEVLPSAAPNMLINGASGIAVGMATNIPPHNLGEIIDGLIAMIDKPMITLDEIMQFIKGPDFPTGGLMSQAGIRQALETGRGGLRLRGRVRFEERGNRQSIIVNEIPYQVNKTSLIQTVAALVRAKRIEDIANLRDESDRHGMRIVFELKRGAHAELVLNQLYKYTQLQTTYSVNNLAIVGRSPKVLPLLDALRLFLEHRVEVVRRRTQFELKKAKERAHILEGYLIALDRLDEVIALIRAAKDGPEARAGLQSEFGLSEVQAQAVLDMRLQRLTGLEREKVQAEYRELMESIAYLQTILDDERELFRVIKAEFRDIKKKFADPRRTMITEVESDISKEDLIAEEEMVVTLTKGGYIKRTPLTSYRAQARGGRGVSAQKQKEDDFNSLMIVGSTHDFLLFFTNRGRVYREKIYDLPEAERAARGSHLRNILPLEDGERVETVLSVKSFDEDGFFFFATRQGMVKKTAIREYGNINASGLIAVNLMDDDELVAVRVTSGRSHVVLATREGQSIRFDESEVRETGRATQGVRGIRLRESDVLVSMTAVSEGRLETAELLAVSEAGYGKRTLLSEYPAQGRGGQGVITLRVTDKTGGLVSLSNVAGDEELLVLSEGGVLIRTRVAEVSRYGRSSQGVTIMRLGEGDRVVSAMVMLPEEALEHETAVSAEAMVG